MATNLTINSITSSVAAIYDKEWLNTNAFYPTCFYVASWDKTSDGQPILTILKNLTAEGLPDLPNCPDFNMEDIVSVSGIPSAGTGFEADTNVLKEKTDKNYASISIKFYVDEVASSWKALQKWREKWKSIKTSADGKSKAVYTLQSKKTQALPEGYLVMDHIRITNEGQLDHLGRLKISGLIPTEIPFFGDVGPGKSRSSEIPTIDVKFICSNITYVASDGTVTQFY